MVLLLALAATVSRADVRPLSDAERGGVEVAAAYLSRGPEAVYERLSPSSPLRTFAHDRALQEIEARLGPPAARGGRCRRSSRR